MHFELPVLARIHHCRLALKIEVISATDFQRSRNAVRRPRQPCRCVTSCDRAFRSDETLRRHRFCHAANGRQFFPFHYNRSQTLRERFLGLCTQHGHHFANEVHLGCCNDRLILKDGAPNVVRHISGGHRTHNARNSERGRGVEVAHPRARVWAVHQPAVQFALQHRAVIDVFRLARDMSRGRIMRHRSLISNDRSKPTVCDGAISHRAPRCQSVGRCLQQSHAGTRHCREHQKSAQLIQRSVAPLIQCAPA